MSSTRLGIESMGRRSDQQIKPTEPDSIELDELEDGTVESITDRSMHECVRFVDGSSKIKAKTIAKSVVMDQSVICGRGMAASILSDSTLKDCVFLKADLAGATWTDNRFVRSRFDECRLIGFDVRMSELRDVVFDHSKMNDALLSETHLSRVRFDNCQLNNADLSGATIESLAVHDCDAQSLRLDGAHITLLDLRGSQIDGISLDHSSVRGIVINPVQAPAIARALGVQVIEREH